MKERQKRRLSSGLLLGLAFAAMLSLLPLETVFAFSVVSGNFNVCSGSPSKCNVAYSPNITNGNTLVVVCGSYSNSASPTVTVNDTKTNTWTAYTNRVVQDPNNNLYYGVFFFTAVASASGADTVSCKASGGTVIYADAYEASAGATAVQSASGTCKSSPPSCSSTASTSNTVTAISGDILIGASMCAGNGCPGSRGWNLPNGWTRVGAQGDNMITFYSVSSLGATYFSASQQTNPDAWVIAGIRLSTQSGTTTTTTTGITSTSTVIGWLVPDPPHWNTGIGAVLFPLVGVGLFAGMGRLLGIEGDVGVTLVLMGLTIGGLLAMLSIGTSTANVLPFALVLVPGADLVIWLWKGGG